jgi:hypothetical protein
MDANTQGAKPDFLCYGSPREQIGWRLIEQLGVASCQSNYRLQKSGE